MIVTTEREKIEIELFFLVLTERKKMTELKRLSASFSTNVEHQSTDRLQNSALRKGGGLLMSENNLLLEFAFLFLILILQILEVDF